MKDILVAFAIGVGTTLLVVFTAGELHRGRMPWEPLSFGEMAPIQIDCPAPTGKEPLRMIADGIGFSQMLDDRSYGMHLIVNRVFDPKTNSIPADIVIDLTDHSQYPLGCFAKVANRSPEDEDPTGNDSIKR